MGNGNGKQTTTGKKARLQRALFVCRRLKLQRAKRADRKVSRYGKNGSKSGFELHSGPLGGATLSGAHRDGPSHMHARTQSSAANKDCQGH